MNTSTVNTTTLFLSILLMAAITSKLASSSTGRLWTLMLALPGDDMEAGDYEAWGRRSVGEVVSVILRIHCVT